MFFFKQGRPQDPYSLDGALVGINRRARSEAIRLYAHHLDRVAQDLQHQAGCMGVPLSPLDLGHLAQLTVYPHPLGSAGAPGNSCSGAPTSAKNPLPQPHTLNLAASPLSPEFPPALRPTPARTLPPLSLPPLGPTVGPLRHSITRSLGGLCVAESELEEVEQDDATSISSTIPDDRAGNGPDVLSGLMVVENKPRECTATQRVQMCALFLAKACCKTMEERSQVTEENSRLLWALRQLRQLLGRNHQCPDDPAEYSVCEERMRVLLRRLEKLAVRLDKDRTSKEYDRMCVKVLPRVNIWIGRLEVKNAKNPFPRDSVLFKQETLMPLALELHHTGGTPTGGRSCPHQASAT